MNTFEQNTGYMEFNIDGNIYTHDAIAYASNLSFKRVDMPQIGVYELLKNDMYKHLIRAYNVGIVHTILPISLLKPTQTDIDYDRILLYFVTEDPVLKQAIEEHEAIIQNETLTQERVEPGEGAFYTETKIDGSDLAIALRKA
jgi:hypothetical protein